MLRRVLRLKIFWISTGILLALALAELVLRIAGEVPGFTGAMAGEYLDMKQVKHLEIQRYFLTDSLGIFRANPDTAFYNADIRINRDGFRGRAFVPAEPGISKKKVLLIGDSFTWGGNANPITACFADQIENAGYYTWNAGMPGTEPNQYAKIAELYVPRLKPDAVVVCFYQENDVMYRRWEPGPYQQKYHVTNAGWLNPFLDGDYLGDAQQTLDYYLRRFSIPQQQHSLRNRMFASTVLGTKLWMALVKWAGMDAGYDPLVKARIEKYKAESQPHPVSAEYLQRIQNVCEANGAKMLLFFIRTHTRLNEPVDPELFGDLKWYECSGLQRGDYHEWPDGHFNNQGHKKFADCLLEKLDSLLR